MSNIDVFLCDVISLLAQVFIVVVVVVVYFQTDIYMYNIPKCYLQLIICIYSLRLHQKARPVMVAQPCFI